MANQKDALGEIIAIMEANRPTQGFYARIEGTNSYDKVLITIGMEEGNRHPREFHDTSRLKYLGALQSGYLQLPINQNWEVVFEVTNDGKRLPQVEQHVPRDVYAEGGKVIRKN